MKRLLFSTLLLLLAVVSRATITFSVDNVKLQRSESIELPVNVTNDEAFAGFEMRIILPQGVSFKGAATNERVAATSRLEGFTITGADQSDGSFKICVVNLLGTPIAAGKGALLKLLLKSADDAPYQEGELTLGSVRYSKDEVLHNVDDVVSKIKVYTNYTITTATADANMGTVSEGASVESATLFTITATPVNGYDFVSWKDGETIVSTDAEYEFTPTKDQTLTAYFEPHVFKATFKSWGTTTPVNVAFGATIEAPTAAAKTGYSFSKWDSEVPATMPASNLEFNAQYTADSYALTYDLKGGALAGDVTNPASYTIESETFTLNNPTKEGYTFMGWTGTDLAEATMEVTITQGSMGARNFTAQWQINQYTMTFKLENGEADVVKTQDYATTLTAPEPTREGYTFKGWDAEIPATIPAADKTFTAQWQINQYTMRFKLENGEADVTIKQDYATALTAPADPTREGYTFKGWDAEIPATIPAADKTFTAQWQINQYTMTFKLENGEADVVKTQDYATALTAPEPTKEGYTFKGWDAEVPATIPAADKTFTAQWQINQYTMTFKLENGEADVVKTQDYATALTAPEPTKEGYTFKGWDAEVPATIPAADKTFTAQWQINQYTMTFKLENGEADVVKTQDYATALTAPEPTKEGYTFKGWDAEVPATIPAADKTFTAQWQINQYTMTFKLENGEADVVKTQDYATALTAPEPTKEGYTFKGWDAEVPATIPAADKTFTAQWQINQYTMTFKLENGEADVVKTQDYATALTAPEPTKEGYTFKGWDAEVPATIPAADKTFTAQWQINQYTMTFKLENGEADVVKTQDYATALTAPEPTKEGYTFKGWDAEVPATIPAADKTFTAQWQINQYTMTFKLENGEADVVKTQDYATALTAPEPTKEGYTFKGWDAEVPATIPAADKTFTAQWQINQYTMTFKLENGEADVVKKQDYATELTAPEPTKEGYTFKGWDAEVPATIPAADKTFTAQWQINQYTMTFKLENGEADVVKKQDYATELTAPANPTRTGFTFKGWSAEVPATVPAEDLSFTAQWERNSYKLLFIVDGSTYSEQTVPFESQIAMPENPAKEGYTFKGWTPEVPATMPAEDVTVTAEFTVNTYKIRYYYGETLLFEDEVAYGAPVVLREFEGELPEGYSFTQWEGDTYETMPAHDISYRALIVDAIRSIRSDAVGIEVWTLSGARVGRFNSVAELKQLRAGIYIINGKKVQVK